MLSRILISLAIVGSFAASADTQAADTVVLQLRWDHQFQFAGYYAADWLGYYEEADLDVEIRSAFDAAGEQRQATREVAEAGAQFGIGAADILRARDEGADLVVLAGQRRKEIAA